MRDQALRLLVGGELVKKMPNLKRDKKIVWNQVELGEDFSSLCGLLKGNAIPTKEVRLSCKKRIIHLVIEARR